MAFWLLIRGPLLEDQLLKLVDTSQATANRRLHRLGELGVLRRTPGKRQTQGRRWEVAVEDELDAFLQSAIDLARAADTRHEAAREQVEGALEARRSTGTRVTTIRPERP